MSLPISVVIPIGPEPHQRAHIGECLDSVLEQTILPAEIVCVESCQEPLPRTSYIVPIVNWYAPYKKSIADAFNLGVSMARNELVMLLGSDDLLRPRCLELCYAAYQQFKDPLGWYSVAVEYSNGYTQNTPCMAAMVTRTLWNKAGGLKSDFSPYPACEIEFISRMILAKGALGATYRVSDEILYWHRIHTPGSVGIA